MIFSVTAGPFPHRGRLLAHVASRAPSGQASITLKFAFSHPGRSDSNFDVLGEDSVASSRHSCRSAAIGSSPGQGPSHKPPLALQKRLAELSSRFPTMTFTSTFSFAPDSVSVKGQKVEVLDLNMRLRDCYNFHDFRRLASFCRERQNSTVEWAFPTVFRGQVFTCQVEARCLSFER